MECCYVCLSEEGHLFHSPCACKSPVHSDCLSNAVLKSEYVTICSICKKEYEGLSITHQGGRLSFEDTCNLFSHVLFSVFLTLFFGLGIASQAVALSLPVRSPFKVILAMCLCIFSIFFFVSCVILHKIAFEATRWVKERRLKGGTHRVSFSEMTPLPSTKQVS